MTTVGNGATPTLSFPPTNRVRITDLSTQREDLSTLYIAAQVVLIWPYSSSTRKFSLLLSETDARPLQGRKQVKVTFRNGAARAAQESRVGIGDELRLQLEGCQWADTDDAISTPGKRIDGDIQFRRHLGFEIVREDEPARQVQYHSTGTPSPVASPAVNGVLDIIQDLRIEPSRISIPYSTPAPRKANRVSSGSYFDSPLDPFAEDKEYVYGRSRKRTKFARPSGDWKLIDDEDELKAEVTSPLGDRGGDSLQEVKAADAQIQINESGASEQDLRESRVADAEPQTTKDTAAPEVIDLISPTVESFETISVQAAKDVNQTSSKPTTLMKPPEASAKTSRREKPPPIDLDEHDDDSDATTTPRLMPMSSPDLPLVSPLIRNTGVEVGYFPPVQDGVSELDAIGQPEEEHEEGRRASTSSSSEASDSADSLVILDEPPKSIQKPIPTTAIGPDVVEDPDMYGAPSPPQPIDEPERQSPQQSKDALDVLEEFLQISPTAPKAPYHVEEARHLEVLGGVEADREQLGPPGSRHEESEADVTDEEEEESSSPDRSQSTGSEVEVQEIRPPSRTMSLDGTMDDADEEPPEHMKAVQNEIVERGSEEGRGSPELLTDVSQQIHREVRPAFDEAAQALRDKRKQLPPTPTHTQERAVDTEFRQVQAEELSLLPTPDNTQEQIPPSQVMPSQEDVAVEDAEETATPSKDAEHAQQPRRVSQRLSRKSLLPENLSSPYFTPRRPQKALRSSPTRDQTPPPSSPPAEAPSSPTRPVTRSQRVVSTAPSEPVVEAEVEEVQASPPSPAVAKEEPTSKTGVLTSGSYYAPLDSLPEHFSQSVDVIAVAADDSSKPERAKSGPKDHYTILHLIDPSIDSSSKTRTSVQIFRPARQALPTTQRGDVVILRNFKVQTSKHKWMLLSTDTSAWAVFNPIPNSRKTFDDVTMSGPPLEYDRTETTQVKKLVQWWQSEGEESFPVFGKKTAAKVQQNGESSVDTTNANTVSSEKDQEVVESIEPPPVSPRRSRRRTNRTDNFGNEEDPAPAISLDGAADTTPTLVRHQPPRRAKSKTPAVNGNAATDTGAEKGSPPTRRARTPQKRVQTPPKPDRKSASVVHELRDGTKYVDDAKEKTGGVTHELRDGRHYVDE